jgi:hypothetical protein
VVFSPGGTVTLTALKWRGTSVAVSNLVAAITVRVIAEGGGVDCASTDVAKITTLRSIPAILNTMMIRLPMFHVDRLLWRTIGSR